MGCLYIATSPSGKSYIGITTRTAEARFSEHVRVGTKYCKAIHAAIKQYGKKSFDVRTLVIADDWNYLCELEKRAIAAFGTFGHGGYNQTIGGDGVAELSSEAKAKHRANTISGTKQAWDTGTLRKSRSEVFATAEFKEQHKAATSAGVRRMYDDPVRRAKIMAALSSEEKRKKQSEIAKAQWADPEFRRKQSEARAVRPPRSAESIKAQSEKMKRLIAERKANGTYRNGK